mmetsp:Transcript_48599/g.94982  ORF Transcript_48599/g.94982 Transcript_48599/m.94982 type:complete len:137 (-) Transcript_48599:264-674(-)
MIPLTTRMFQKTASPKLLLNLFCGPMQVRRISSVWSNPSRLLFGNGLLPISVSVFRKRLFAPMIITERNFGAGAMKTNKSAAKRFRVTGKGALRRSKAGKSHNTGKKTMRSINNLAQSSGIKGKAIEKRIKRLLKV